MSNPTPESLQRDEFEAKIARVRAGDDEATAELWQTYFEPLVRVAAGRLPAGLRRSGDEEDVALSAFHSFIAGVRRDAFPDLVGPDNLWRLLITLATRKAGAHRRHQTRHKRGGGGVRGESVFIDPSDPSRNVGIGAVGGGEAPPDLKAELSEACEDLLGQLPDEQLREIALLRMDGYLVDEIAERLVLSKRAVERRLQLIRQIWSEHEL